MEALMLLQEAAAQAAEAIPAPDATPAAGPDRSLDQAMHTFYGIGAAAFFYVALFLSIVSALGLLFMTMAVAPNVTTRLSTTLREHNVRSFFVGMGVFAGFAVLAAVGSQVHVIGVPVVVAFAITLILSLTAGAEDVGRRLYWACGKEGSRAAHLASGWLVFSFASSVPVLGWFVIFPYVMLSGMGATLTGLFQGRKPAAKDIEYPAE